MTQRRSYRQHCGVARALDVVGERWTLLVVRELLLGPRRFADLEHALTGLTPTLLTRRLRHLQAEGLIEKQTLPPPAGSRVYALTVRGRELEPVVLALGRFGAAELRAGPRPGDAVEARWGMLSLRRRYRDLGGRGRLECRVAERAFALELGHRLTVADGGDPDAGARVSGPLPAWGAWLMGGDGSGLTVAGDRSLLDALSRSVALPP